MQFIMPEDWMKQRANLPDDKKSTGG